MNKKILIVNICIILLMLIITEIGLFWNEYFNLKEFDKLYGGDGSIELKYNPTLLSEETIYRERNDVYKNAPLSEDYKKGSILLFGCSFAYGVNLNVEDTLAYRIEKETQRAVYNRGISGGGVQHMYDQLYRKELLKDINTVPEYIIYLYIHDLHYERLHLYTYQLFDDYLRIEYDCDNNEEFKLKKRILPKFINGLYIIRYINHYIDFKKMEAKKEQYEKEIILLMKKSKEKVQELNPNAKFILLNLELNYIGEEGKKERKIFLEKMKQNGIEVIDLEELTGIEYWKCEYTESETDTHPNSKYWDIAAPLIIKELKL